MLQPEQSYSVGETVHILPRLKGLSKYRYGAKARQNHLHLLKLLDDFDTLCDLQDLNYTISGKTLLGALRHQGCIPWEPNAEVEVGDVEAERLEAMFELASEWQLKKVEYGYRLQGRHPEPYIDILLTSYSHLLHKYVCVANHLPLYASSHEELHPRRRYEYESITLWGPQQGETLVKRRYGEACLVEVVRDVGESWQVRLGRCLRMLRGIIFPRD